MRSRSQNPFVTVKTSGLLLPVDLLARVVDDDPELPGLTRSAYHLVGSERLSEAVARSWNVCLAAWRSYRESAEGLAESDAETSLTRERWLLPLFQERGYGRLQTSRAIEIDEKSYPVSHA